MVSRIGRRQKKVPDCNNGLHLFNLTRNIVTAKKFATELRDIDNKTRVNSVTVITAFMRQVDITET